MSSSTRASRASTGGLTSFSSGPSRFRCQCVDGQWQAEGGNREEFAARISADNLIGSGSMGAVYKVTFRGAPAAGKTLLAFSNPESCGLDLQQQSARDQLMDLAKKAEPEITVLMSILRHPSLCSCLGVGYSSLCGIDVPMWIIMELADENLKTSLHGEGGGALPPAEALRRWIQILTGLDVLHALGIVHRNIKPSNILVRKDKQRFLLADYGLARLRNCMGDLLRSSNGKTGRSQGAEVLYQGPEGSSSSTSSGRKGDAYAAALCLAEMLTGEEPSESNEARAQWILRAGERLPAPAANALVRAASQDPKNRPAVAETLFSIFDALTTIDLNPVVRQAAPDHSIEQNTGVRIKVLGEKVQAWEELYQTAAAARDELHQQLDACNSELRTYRTIAERRDREVKDFKICKAEMQAEGRALREELAQRDKELGQRATLAAADDREPRADRAASEILRQMASALAEQCRLAEEGERRLLVSEAYAERRIGELGVAAEAHEEATAAILQECAAAMLKQEALAAAGEQRLEEAVAREALNSSLSSLPIGAAKPTDADTAKLLSEQLAEQKGLMEVLEHNGLDQQHEIDRLRLELAEAKLQLRACEEASEGLDPVALDPHLSNQAGKPILRSASGKTRANSQPNRTRVGFVEDSPKSLALQVEAGKIRAATEMDFHISDHVKPAKTRAKTEVDLHSSDPQQEVSELEKVLNQRRNKVASREKVFASNEQPASQADASWKKKRATFRHLGAELISQEDLTENSGTAGGSGIQDADALSRTL